MVCWPGRRRQQSLIRSTPLILLLFNTGLALMTGSLICHHNSWKISGRWHDFIFGTSLTASVLLTSSMYNFRRPHMLFVTFSPQAKMFTYFFNLKFLHMTELFFSDVVQDKHQVCLWPHLVLFTAQRREATHFLTVQFSRWRGGPLGRATPPGALDSPPGRTANPRRRSRSSRTVSRSCMFS